MNSDPLSLRGQRNGKQGINLEWPYKPKGTTKGQSNSKSGNFTLLTFTLRILQIKSHFLRFYCSLFRIGLATKLRPMLFIWNAQSITQWVELRTRMSQDRTVQHVACRNIDEEKVISLGKSEWRVQGVVRVRR